jgi:serine protease
VAAGGCLTDYSNYGTGLDLVAPGGGASGLVPDVLCFLTKPNTGALIHQVTFSPPDYTSFDIVGLKGTSLASAQVSGAVALILASGVLGPSPTPEQVEQRLKSTAKPLKGPPGTYAAGLLDAAAATAP